MAKASEPNLHTRRGFSKWLAGASIAATAPLPAIAAPIPATVDWDQAELELGCAWAHVAWFDEEIAKCAKAVELWKKRNPWPDAPDYETHAESAADYKNQSARESAWVHRYQIAVRQTGKGKLGGERLVAHQKYIAECERVAKLPVGSLADYKAKTRVARFEVAGGPIHQALIEDLKNI